MKHWAVWLGGVSHGRSYMIVKMTGWIQCRKARWAWRGQVGQGGSRGAGNLWRQNVLANTTGTRLGGRPGQIQSGRQPGNWALGRYHLGTGIRPCLTFGELLPAALAAHLIFFPWNFLSFTHFKNTVWWTEKNLLNFEVILNLQKSYKNNTAKHPSTLYPSDKRSLIVFSEHFSKHLLQNDPVLGY